MTKVYKFKDSYYIGDNLSDELKEKAQIEEIEMPEGYTIKVEDYKIKLIKEEDLYAKGY